MYHLVPLPFFLISLGFTVLLRRRWVTSLTSESHTTIRTNHLVYGAFKILTQLIVILTGFLGFFFTVSKSLAFSVLVLSGLCVSLIGDIALFNMRSDKGFLAGLLVFLIAVSMYATGVTLGAGFRILDLLPGALLAAVYALLLAYFMPGLKKSFRSPLVVYGFVWCFLISRALTLFYSPSFSLAQALLVTFGTIAFFYGDIRIAIWKFKRPGLSLTIETVTYAAGQLCMALSLAYFPV
jgi:hypothetical protein